ncbi:hypothetical protein MAMC_00019 [Methylacidimicrobium cyclopophantes]|uniref:Uncharacterized protein n=1 Tax=Methylacidimicrobium cyclopophantes TaxID=1041766 RepID=A0A5E6M603_9BACT|nr:hypothetical protein [Methylacidimicrobium cyclopophantes]VVM04345.1 hypothetical protein MAMC_00019 [Methylacidimicrobium cyclopophantes]
MSERLWRVLVSGSAGVLLFFLAAYGLRAVYSWKHEPERLRANLIVILALGFLLAFLAFLARLPHP